MFTADLFQRMGKREEIDKEVYQWAVTQNELGVILSPIDIRQKAYEIGEKYGAGFKASQNWYANWKKRMGYKQTGEEEVGKNRKRAYTAAFKLQAVQKAAEMESASQAALALSVSRRCLQRWRKEVDIIATVADEAGTAVYRRPGQGRKVSDANLDRILLEWISSSWVQGISLTSTMIRDKALELRSDPSFKASLGWYVKFSRRYSLDLKGRTYDSSAGKNDLELKLRILPDEIAGDGIITSSLVSSASEAKKPRSTSFLDDAVNLHGWTEHYDRVLLNWVVSRIQGGEKVQRKLLRDKALELCSSPSFKAAPGWLNSWVEKHQLYNICGPPSELFDDELAMESYQSHSHFSPLALNSCFPNMSVSGKASSSSTSSEAPEHFQKSSSSLGFLPLESLRLPQSLPQPLTGELVATLSTAHTSTTPTTEIASDTDLLTLTTEVVEVASEEVVTEEGILELDGDHTCAHSSFESEEKHSRRQVCVWLHAWAIRCYSADNLVYDNACSYSHSQPLRISGPLWGSGSGGRHTRALAAPHGAAPREPN